MSVTLFYWNMTSEVSQTLPGRCNVCLSVCPSHTVLRYGSQNSYHKTIEGNLLLWRDVMLSCPIDTIIKPIVVFLNGHSAYCEYSLLATVKLCGVVFIVWTKEVQLCFRIRHQHIDGGSVWMGNGSLCNGDDVRFKGKWKSGKGELIYVHTYVHTYIHTYIHTYVHTYIHTYIYTYIRTYIHTYIHTYVHTYIHTYVHI